VKITAVIFDLFGTLVDEFASSVGQMNLELATALDVPMEPFMRLWRETAEMRTNGAFQTVEDSIEHVCRILGAQITEEQMTQAVAIRLRYTRHALKPRPDAVETLAQIKDQGYKLGLLSNCSIEIPILWPETALANLIDEAIFSSRERLSKPDPRIYHLISTRLQVAPENCLYIADGENYELRAGAALGMRVILIRTPGRQLVGEVLREAREWHGQTIAALREVTKLVGME
jgi:putative hydrolase of the HAD superfamily